MNVTGHDESKKVRLIRKKKLKMRERGRRKDQKVPRKKGLRKTQTLPKRIAKSVSRLGIRSKSTVKNRPVSSKADTTRPQLQKERRFDLRRRTTITLAGRGSTLESKGWYTDNGL